MKGIFSLALCLVAVATPAFGIVTIDFSVDTACNGSNQSPIDFISASAVDNSTLSISYGAGYSQASHTYTFMNSGTAALFTSSSAPADFTVTIDDGAYTFYAMAIAHSSHHTVDGTRYAAEIHLIHYMTSLGSWNAALASSDQNSVAVVAVLAGMDPNDADNTDVAELIANIADAMYDGNSTTATTTRSLNDIFSDPMADQFYRYYGSFTLQDCEEVVVWSVYKTPILISNAQLTALGTMLDASDASLTDYYRVVQSIGSRTVWSSVMASASNHFKPAVMTMVIMACLTKIFF